MLSRQLLPDYTVNTTGGNEAAFRTTPPYHRNDPV
jgi:hypothetical protein